MLPAGMGPYESIDGTGNNAANPNWGAAGIDLVRLSPPAYADGVSTPSLAQDPSARAISNILNSQADAAGNNIQTVSQLPLSDFAYTFGQFMDHDMSLTLDNGASDPIPVAPGDPIGGPGPTPVPLAFNRSQPDPATGTGPGNPAQNINYVTSYLDLSQVYGSDINTDNALRTFAGGLMKTSPGGLPPLDNSTYFTDTQLAQINAAEGGMQDFGPLPPTSMFVTGDVRGNENLELMALQTLFLDNHNNIAAQLQQMNPTWTDEQLFQEARKINIAEYQSIVFSQWIPDLYGAEFFLPPYPGYNPNANASIANEFSTVAFRFGHSLISDEVPREGNNGLPVAPSVNLALDFFDPSLLNGEGMPSTTDPLTGLPSTSIDAVLKGDADHCAQAMDPMAINEIRNLLFNQVVPGQGYGQDLIATDIQRGRDHGIGSYNQVRAALGLQPLTSFDQITSNVQVQQELSTAYGGNINNVDAIEGGMAENPVPASITGVLFQTIMRDQFENLRDGDQYFYLNESFPANEQAMISARNTLAEVIEANTQVTNLQYDVFLFRTSLTGTVFADLADNGVMQPPDAGIPGVTVQLRDASGNVVAQAVTDSNGQYSFNPESPGGTNVEVAPGLSATGNYTLVGILPSNFAFFTITPPAPQITVGDTALNGQNFGVFTVTSAGPLALTVNTAADNAGGTATELAGPNGTLSLREAILASNLNIGGTNTISFAVGDGTQTLAITSALPAISQPVVIDATPPAAFPGQTIVLEGPGPGLNIVAGKSTINGDGHLAVVGFNATGGSGIVLAGAGGDVVTGTFIGTDASGASGLGNWVGITISSPDDTVGGTAAGAGNFISGNLAGGIVITGTAAVGNVIEGNVIGTNAQGTAALANGGAGILIEAGASGNSVGGATNVISGNAGDGVHITGAGTDHNVVLGAVIGTDLLGGSALGNGGAGVRIDLGAADNTVGATGGSAINLISGNLGDGVVIGAGSGDGATTRNLVDSNAIGTDVSGTRAVPNRGDGVHLQGGAAGNTVGNSAGGAINLLSANGGWGVEVDGGGGAGTGNRVDNNAIGTDASGTTGLGNGLGGVYVHGGADRAIVGGTTAINLIAGNTGPGVLIDGSSACQVVGNAIGTDVTGAVALANAGDGVRVQNGAADNTIGGTSAGSFNIISGNTGNGVTLTGTGTSRNTIVSNAIGTAASGRAAIPNAVGVAIEGGAAGNAVGVPGSGTNLISGNTGDGVLVQGDGNTLAADVIGADVSGTAALANGGSGVEIAGSNNAVGLSIDFQTGAMPGQENIIAYNGADGVQVDSGSGNTMLVDLVFANAGLGIDLAPGTNGGVAAPVLSGVTTSGGTSTVAGSLHGAAATTYLIEFFASATGTGGQGQTHLGFALVTTDAAGNAPISFATPALPAGQFVTATATDALGNTSSFSGGIAS